MTNYTIINPNFDSIYDKLTVFDQYNFSRADKSTHQYKASLHHWQNIFNTTNKFLYRMKNQYSIEEINKVINNIINDNLININNIQIEEKTLVAWAKQLHQRKYYFHYYCYQYGLEKTKLHIQEMIKNFTKNSHPAKKEKINSIKTNEIKSASNEVNNIIQIDNNIKDKVTLTAIGKLFTINNITNNIRGWAKLLNTNSQYLYILSQKSNDKVIAFIKRRLKKKNDDNYIEVNGLYATYQQWSLFINQHKLFLNDMIYKMGFDYTKQYLYNTVINNQNFITSCKTITINNESCTLFSWAKKINKQATNLYQLNKTHGLDYVINYIKKHLNNNITTNNDISTIIKRYKVVTISK